MPKTLFFYGDRKINIIHARLRNKCSGLNQHLYRKNVAPSPLCDCDLVELNERFFLESPKYTDAINAFFNGLPNITLNLRVLLFGDDNLGHFENETIFAAVHSYICNSKTFN